MLRCSNGLVVLLLVAGCGPSNSTQTNDLATGQGGDLAVAQDLAAPSCPPCAAPTPLCDTKTFTCVACLKDGDCGAGQLCMAGSCHAGCSSTHAACAPDAGSCDVDLGACRGCLSDSECGSATPRCDVGNGVCVPCLPTNDNCPTGSYCASQNGVFSCQTGCKTKSDCAAPPDGGVGDGGSPDGGTSTAECCNHVCVDTSTDNANCGACGVTCQAKTCCASSCIDLTTSTDDCGGCGVSCAILVANASAPACVGSMCTYNGACVANFGDCDGNKANGCETDLTTSTANCSSCGNNCNSVVANAGGVACAGAMCTYTGACANGFGDCDGNKANGCETDLTTSTANCNGCGNDCNTLVGNASGVACVAGSCTYTGSCAAGFADCDGNKANGCETNLNTSTTSCGACGTNCNTLVAHASGAACNGAGTCTYTGSCASGFSDCDGNRANGCEKAVAPGCGTCAQPCTGSDRSCNGSSCVVCGTNDVGFGGKCYYLDGSGGCCLGGYTRVSQSILTSIAPLFAGKNYKTTVSSNCCIWNADVNENYGMANHCNTAGPFTSTDVALGGANCNNVTNHNHGQLTLCGTGVSNEVPSGGRCYYLDGSKGTCDPGYAMVSQSILASINTQFVGKSVKHTAFNNCCIENADSVENYGMGGTDCGNTTGPWGTGPVAGAAGCTNATQMNTQQLTLCASP